MPVDKGSSPLGLNYLNLSSFLSIFLFSQSHYQSQSHSHYQSHYLNLILNLRLNLKIILYYKAHPKIYNILIYNIF